MKKLLIFLLLCSLGFSQYNTPINFELLEERDGLYYQYNSPKPFSGKVFNIQGRSEGSFRNGKKSGKFSFYFDNGQLKSQGYYSNNLQQRKWTYYYENGQINGTGSYKDGDGTDLIEDTEIPTHGRTGQWKYFYENGQLEFKATYKNGLYGPFKLYYENGQLKSEGTVKDGKEDGPYKSYYENGQIKMDNTFRNGIQIGAHESFYDNGNKNYLYYYNQDGTRDSTIKLKRWYENGQLWYEGYVITVDDEDVWNGTYKSYYEDGQLKSEKTYKNGELIDSQEY
tara:strand:- start:36 stop:881 length:846 start_codon:yes stop_codon:yes gene_type:complete